MGSVVDREQFAAVDGRGDTRAVIALLREQACATSSSPAIDDSTDLLWRRRRPAPRAIQWRRGNDDFKALLVILIDRDDADAIKWLFSAEAIATIGPEPLVAVVPSVCCYAMDNNALTLLDLVLASPVFTQFFPGPKQHKLFDGMLRGFSSRHSFEIIGLLAAHGAFLHSPSPAGGRPAFVLAKVARKNDPSRIDAVIRAGVFTVGTRVFDGTFDEHIDTVRHLLSRGCRPIDAGSCLHHIVVSKSPETVGAWLEHVCIDVDARDSEGKTPLMRTASLQKFVDHRLVLDQERGVRIAKLLLAYGANVSARDSDGKTPLRHAIGADSPIVIRPGEVSYSCNSEVLRLLLEHGADPNQTIQGDQVALDFLNVHRLDDRSVAKQLEYLLRYGADPFLPRADGISAVDRLRETEAGAAFIVTHPQWFLHC